MSVFEELDDDGTDTTRIHVNGDLRTRLRNVEGAARARGMRLAVQAVLLRHLQDLVAAAEAELASPHPASLREGEPGVKPPTAEDALTS